MPRAGREEGVQCTCMAARGEFVFDDGAWIATCVERSLASTKWA